jgi:hypothetical protein
MYNKPSYPSKESLELPILAYSFQGITREDHDTNGLKHLDVSLIWDFVKLQVKVATQCRNQVSRHYKTKHERDD